MDLKTILALRHFMLRQLRDGFWVIPFPCFGITNRATRYLFLGFITASLAISSGCTTKRLGDGVGPASAGAIARVKVDSPFVIAFTAQEFRKARGHWPKDHAELSNFAKMSDNERCKTFRSMQFSRIEFSELPDGRLEINAQYSTDSDGSIGIEGMRISADETK